MISSIKRIVGRMLCLPIFGRALRGCSELTRYGITIDLSRSEINDSVRMQLFWGLYEKAEISFVNRYLPGDYPVIELGGSLGVVSSVIANKILGQQFFIVEANPVLLPVVSHHLKLNGRNPSAVVYAGIGGGGQLFFLQGKSSTGGQTTNEYTRGAMKVPSLSLRDLIERFGVQEYSLVSDIEGAERSFIFDDPDVLKDCRHLIIELHDMKDIFVEDYLIRLERIGFVIKDQHGPVIYAYNNRH